MNCEQVKEYLNAYIDGFLSDEIKEQVEAHLAQCSACKNEADALLALRGEIRALKLENTDDFVFDIERAKAPAVLPMRRKGWLRAISATAACFVLLIGVYTAVQNGYQTPAVQKPSLGNADAASDIALASEAAGENIVKTRSSRTKTVPLSEDYAYRAMPEGVTPFSGVAPESEAVEESQNAKVEFFVDMDVQESSAGASVADDISASSPDGAGEASIEQKSSGASAGGGSSSGASAARCVKRTVTLAVSAEARESFVKLLSGLLLPGFDGEAVIGEADLQQLLYADGVTLVSDETAATDTDAYSAKIVIRY